MFFCGYTIILSLESSIDVVNINYNFSINLKNLKNGHYNIMILKNRPMKIFIKII